MICPHCNRTITRAQLSESLSDSDRAAVADESKRRTGRVAYILPDPEDPRGVVLVRSPHLSGEALE